MGFERIFNQELIYILKSDLLFQKLVSDNEVFPAIRNNYIDFYYRGCGLCKYDNQGYTTHQKYATLWMEKPQYIRHGGAHSIALSKDFLQDYELIKANCRTYASGERKAVSRISVLKPYHRLLSDDVVVLDTEIAFESYIDDRERDQPDLLLFNLLKKSLRFVEAKLFTNDQLWASPGNKAEVFTRIKEYELQIANRRQEILEGYRNYVLIANDLFDVNLPLPEIIEDQVNLLIFDFDQEQRRGERFKSLLLENTAVKNKGYRYYAVGNPAQCNLSGLFKGIPI